MIMAKIRPIDAGRMCIMNGVSYAFQACLHPPAWYLIKPLRNRIERDQNLECAMM